MRQSHRCNYAGVLRRRSGRATVRPPTQLGTTRQGVLPHVRLIRIRRPIPGTTVGRTTPTASASTPTSSSPSGVRPRARPRRSAAAASCARSASSSRSKRREVRHLGRAVRARAPAHPPPAGPGRPQRPRRLTALFFGSGYRSRRATTNPAENVVPPPGVSVRWAVVTTDGTLRRRLGLGRRRRHRARVDDRRRRVRGRRARPPTAAGDRPADRPRASPPSSPSATPRRRPSWPRVHPESGGTYVYGRERLGPCWGHLAGWGFVVGKTAQLRGDGADRRRLPRGRRTHRLVGVAAVVALTAVNLGGLDTHRRRHPGRCVAVVLAALAAVVVAGWSAAGRRRSTGSPRSTPAPPASCGRPGSCSSPSPATPGSPRSARRSATRPGRSPGRSRWRSASCSSSTPSSASRCSPSCRSTRSPAADAPLQPSSTPPALRRPGTGRARRRRRRRARRAAQPASPACRRTVLAMARRRELPGGSPPSTPAARCRTRAELAVAAVVVVAGRRSSTCAARSASPASPCSPTTRSPTPPP